MQSLRVGLDGADAGALRCDRSGARWRQAQGVSCTTAGVAEADCRVRCQARHALHRSGLRGRGAAAPGPTAQALPRSSPRAFTEAYADDLRHELRRPRRSRSSPGRSKCTARFPARDVAYRLKHRRARTPAARSHRPGVFSRVPAAMFDCPVYDRYALAPGHAIDGPALDRGSRIDLRARRRRSRASSTSISISIDRRSAEAAADELRPDRLGIQWDRLISIADEIINSLVRTSFSTNVRESYDLSCVVFDSRGRSIAQGCVQRAVVHRHRAGDARQRCWRAFRRRRSSRAT